MKNDYLKMILENIQMQMEHKANSLKYLMMHGDKLNEILDELEGERINIISVEANPQYISLSFTGTRKDYIQFLRVMGSHDFRRTTIPEDSGKETTAYGFLTDPNDMTFWVHFSSTSCTRVKVGTKMVEQDVYDTVCQDDVENVAPE